MDYKLVAKEIVKEVGGVENILGLEHCSTRLRFTLLDDSIVDVEKLEKIPGVMKVIINSQCQVVIGNEVNEVYEEVIKLTGDIKESNNKSEKKRKPLDVILDYLISIFQPLVPAIAGAGILKSLLLVFAMTPLLDETGSTYLLMMNAADTALYFLPILVAFTTAKKLKVNELVAVTIVAITVMPNILSMLSDGSTLFGITVESISYPYQVFPAILIVFVYAPVERFFTKYSPKPIRIFFVSMMSILVMTPIALLILGPLGYNIGTVLTTIILTVYSHFGWFAVALLAGILPFMVAAGMHKALVPYTIASISTTGYELLYLPASLAHNISEAGMCFAVALRTKDDDKKSTAISAAISASCGITEPALYGVTLQNKYCMISVVIGALISGAFIGLAAVKAFTVVGPGIPSMTMFIDSTDPSNFIKAVIAFVIALVSSFVITFIIYKEEDKKVLEEVKPVQIKDDLNGETIALETVKDEVFASKKLGDGYAKIPSTNKLLSPVDATVEMIFPTKHAIGLKLDNGAEMLIHIGIDTVNIKEEVFKALVEVGQRVKLGDELIDFNLDKIKELGYDSTIMFVITNLNKYQIIKEENGFIVKGKGDNVK